MALVRWRLRREWDPFAGLLDLQREMSSFFAPALTTEEDFGAWAPPVDVYSDDDKVVVEAELSGLKKDEIEVSFDQGCLNIRGERKHEEEFKEEGYHRVERRFGSFHRAVRIPAEVDPSKCAAEMKDGLLRITLPKAEQAKARKIEVKEK
jgi:HSP20 family protein